MSQTRKRRPGKKSDRRGLENSKARVAIVKANNYDYDVVHSAVEQGIESIGGLSSIIKPGNKVLVKINHISPPSAAERGLVTHPIFVEAVLDLLKKTGADITVGDDIQASGDGFQVSGFRQMCEKAGVKLVNFREAGFVDTACNGHFLETLHVAKVVDDADVLINLPKLKTHSLCVLTAGIKNMYGTIPLGLRRKIHTDYIRSDDFSKALVDIFSLTKPQLTIIDGIIAMEGEGPAGGNLRKLGIILTSRDTVAADAVATEIIGLNPMDIDTTRFAHERNMGIGDLNRIDVVGTKIKDVTVTDFKLPASAVNVLSRKIPKVLPRFILHQLSVKPNVTTEQCTGCGECERICPVGAIVVRDKIAMIDHSLCIECFCCHEVCRFNAITPRRSTVGNMLHVFISILPNIMNKIISVTNRGYPSGKGQPNK